MKYYLLIAGLDYYPQSGTEDWIGTFSSYEEAFSQVEEEIINEYYSKGKKKGEVKDSMSYYKINGHKYDWFEIVNLEKWI